MLKKILELYKVPFLISLALSIVIIGLTGPRSAINITQIFLGALLGTFILDLDYIIYAFFLEPEKDFSKTLSGFVRHGDVGNALSFVYYHKDDIKDKTLHSAFFQLILAALAILAASSVSSLFVQVTIVSAYANSIYRFAEHYYEGKLDAWFWALKEKPSQKGLYGYWAIIVFALIFILGLF